MHHFTARLSRNQITGSPALGGEPAATYSCQNGTSHAFVLQEAVFAFAAAAAFVPGATHLIKESAALEAVERLACGWFMRYLRPETRPTP
jgi:hypothetical protein